MPNRDIESLVYITPDGIEYSLHSPGVRLTIQQDGTGMPPIEYLTQRGPYQHGETLINFHLRPRIIEVLLRFDACNRDDYWRNRGGILTHLSPRRQALGELATARLRQVTSTSEFRDIDCLVQEGPSFTPHDRGVWDEWAFTDIVRFICFNPLYYNPAQQSSVYGPLTGELTFPITFPILFTSANVSSNVTYLGNWPEFPTIIITGPVNRPIITNTTTGEVIDLNTEILAGETITIDLSYGQKTVTKQDGTNLIGFITSDSDLTSFHLEPAPGATGGINVIDISSSGGGGATSITLRWYNRYLGLGL